MLKRKGHDTTSEPHTRVGDSAMWLHLALKVQNDYAEAVASDCVPPPSVTTVSVLQATEGL
jgi:hypothetical protein